MRKPEIELKFELELLYSNQRNFILNSVHAPTWIRSLKGQLTWIFFVWFFCSHRQNFSFWFYITKFLSTLVTWLSCGKQTKFDNPHCWAGTVTSCQNIYYAACALLHVEASALIFRDFAPRLEILILFKDFLGIFGKAWKCVKWTILVYFANRIWFYFQDLLWHFDFMLHHHRFRDFLVLFYGFSELHLWEP